MKKKSFKIKPSIIFIIISVAAMIIIIPQILTGYPLMVVNTGLMFSIVSFSLSLLLGMGGQLSFAGLTFMGIGAYFVGNMCSGRLGFWLNPQVSVLLGTIVSGAIAFLLGLLLFKLKGTYFTFATIALVQVSFSFFQNYEPAFGGPGGISNIAPLQIGKITFTNALTWFYFLSIVLIIVSIVVERIRQTKLGRSLASIRDNETAALTLGVNVYMTKVIAFTIAGMLAAIAGGFYALHNRFIGSDMFTFERSTLFIIMAMVGGVNSSIGVVIGSMLITVLPELLRSMERYLQFFYGFLVIIFMVFMPMGLAGLFSNTFAWIKSKLFEIKTSKEV